MAQPNSPAAPPTSRGAKFALGMLIALSCLVVIALASFLFGSVSGEEFNPHTFQRRKFQFYEIPWLRWQVYPLARSSASTAMDEFVENKYTKPVSIPPEDWHLFSFQRSAVPSPPFDASILKTYLDTRDNDSQYYWLKWSEHHDKLSDILWPAVIRLARVNAYLAIPHLFQAAKTAEDPAEFQQNIEELTLAALVKQAERARAAEDSVTELAAWRAVLEIQPKHETALQREAELKANPPSGSSQ